MPKCVNSLQNPTESIFASNSRSDWAGNETNERGRNGEKFRCGRPRIGWIGQLPIKEMMASPEEMRRRLWSGFRFPKSVLGVGEYIVGIHPPKSCGSFRSAHGNRALCPRHWLCNFIKAQKQENSRLSWSWF